MKILFQLKWKGTVLLELENLIPIPTVDLHITAMLNFIVVIMDLRYVYLQGKLIYAI